MSRLRDIASVDLLAIKRAKALGWATRADLARALYVGPARIERRYREGGWGLERRKIGRSFEYRRTGCGGGRMERVRAMIDLGWAGCAEMCAAAGVSRQTLLNWVDLGLLIVRERAVGGQYNLYCWAGGEL